MSRYIAWITQALFVVSLLSGLIIVFAYYPSQAYDSVQKIEYIIPFGAFFRQLHYFSSEVLVISLLLHVGIEVSKKEIKITFNSWIYSILAFLILLFLMFTGFVLKADQSANAAAQVAFSLINDTPILDKFLALLKDNTVFYWKFFVWHILFLPIIVMYAVIKHTRRLKVDMSYFTLALGVSLFLALVFKMPRDIALEESVVHVKGPWFFWGAENLLQIGRNAVNVNLILFLPFVFLMLIYKKSNQKVVKVLLSIWVIVYAYFSI